MFRARLATTNFYGGISPEQRLKVESIFEDDQIELIMKDEPMVGYRKTDRKRICQALNYSLPKDRRKTIEMVKSRHMSFNNKFDE